MVSCTYQAVAYWALMQTMSEKNQTNFLLSVKAISNTTNARTETIEDPENHTGYSVCYTREMSQTYLNMVSPWIDTTFKSLLLNSAAAAKHSLWQGRRKGMKSRETSLPPLHACKIKPFSVGQLAL